VPEDFAVPLPEQFSDVEAAPLLCAGIVGYRSVKLSDLKPGERLGLYGFGASASIALQIARYWKCWVYVFTRNPQHQRDALNMGAVWVGEAQNEPPQKLDRAIIFAPAGWIVPLALGHLRKGGTLCINAIHMNDIPSMPYSLLWHERTIRTVANATRQDAEEFLPLAAKIPIHNETQVFDLSEANRVLRMLKHSEINGAAILKIQ
jgi:propanol-preferring alcohol dehydrogenase